MAHDDTDRPLSIIVIGASGDLAQKKIFPALFGLFCRDFLPDSVNFFGFSRTDMTSDSFREQVQQHLSCRYEPDETSCANRMDDFLKRCHYVSGHYDDPGAFIEMYSLMKSLEGDGGANRLFYMAIPPFVFLDVARSIGDAGLVSCGAESSVAERKDTGGWTRAVIEKPFGHDRSSSDELVADMARVFSEEQTYRIDHYLGKEVIQNLLVLRFANTILTPLWCGDYIRQVTISWQEEHGVHDRAGYFNRYGIIRDVFQNHLFQIVALIAMEPPESRDARHLRNAKNDVLRHIAPLSLDDVVVGQYTAATHDGEEHRGYREEPGIDEHSTTPTFAALAFTVDTPRWAGVPFFVRGGKALDAKMTEVRIHFKEAAPPLFANCVQPGEHNSLVIRVQPDERIGLRIFSKVPGVGMELTETQLDLHYSSAFRKTIPDAYETLLLDVLEGDKSLFIRSDELAAAWDIFTPLLHTLESQAIEPEGYNHGSKGPAGVCDLAQRKNLILQPGEEPCA